MVSTLLLVLVLSCSIPDARLDPQPLSLSPSGCCCSWSQAPEMPDRRPLLLRLLPWVLLWEGWLLMEPTPDACCSCCCPVSVTGTTQGITPDAMRSLSLPLVLLVLSPLLLLVKSPEASRARLPLLLLPWRVLWPLDPAEPPADCGRLDRAAKRLGPAAHPGPSAASS